MLWGRESPSLGGAILRPQGAEWPSRRWYVLRVGFDVLRVGGYWILRVRGSYERRARDVEAGEGGAFALAAGLERLELVDGLDPLAVEVGQRALAENALPFRSAQMFSLYWDEGRLEQLEMPIKTYVQQFPAIVTWRCVLALVFREMGREKEARAEFEDIAKDDFAGLPQNVLWLIGIAVIAEVCAFLGDAARATVLYDLLPTLRQPERCRRAWHKLRRLRFALPGPSGYYHVALGRGGSALRRRYGDEPQDGSEAVPGPLPAGVRRHAPGA